MKELGFILCHGWGLDSHYWEPLLKELKPAHFLLWDLGYFGEESLPEPHENCHWIGIGHSLGICKLLERFPQLKWLLGLQSFTNFLGFEKSENLRRQRILLQMQREFSKNPEAVLKNFHQTAKFCFRQKPSAKICLPKLANDLQFLERDLTDHLNDKLLIIMGLMNDSIVPSSLLRQHSDRRISVDFFPGNGHEIAFSNPTIAAEWIRCCCQKWSAHFHE